MQGVFSVGDVVVALRGLLEGRGWTAWRGGSLHAVPCLDFEMLKAEMFEYWEDCFNSLEELDKFELLVGRALGHALEVGFA